MFAGKKSAQIREILISESAWEEMTCLFAPSLALAGFRQEDLDIQLEGTRLTVKGTPEPQEKETKWLHQGLVTQAFSLSFTLAENMEVAGATFTNGLLHIDLTRNEPEAIAPQRIAISERPALNS